MRAVGVRGGLEGPIVVAVQHRGIARPPVDRRQRQHRFVPNLNRGRQVPGGIADRVLKAAIMIGLQHRDAVGAKVRDGQTGDDAVVEGHDRVRAVANLVRRPRPEAAVAEAEPDRRRIAPGFGEGEVKLAIPVEVVEEQRGWMAAGRKGMLDGRLEASVAIAQHDRIGVAVAIGDHQVGIAIVVHVANPDPHRSAAGHRIDRGLEGAIAVSQQHRNRVRSPVRGDQVELPILIDVGGHEVCGGQPNGIGLQ